jgi:long-subunit fatty acid transport protein
LASKTAIFLLLLLSPAVMAAASDQPYPVGELSSTMGGAAVATVHDGSATWYNPAGLGRVTEEGISATLNVYGIQSERTKGFVDGHDLTGWSTTIFPGSIGYVKPLGVFGDGFHHAVGLALVVPDFARHNAALDEKVQEYEYHIRERLLEQTLWIVPGWGVCFSPRLCAGVSLQVGYWSSTGSYSEFEQSTVAATTTTGDSAVEQDDFSAVQAGMSVGVQYQATDSTWIGFSIRSPVRTIWGGGSVLYMDANDPSAPAGSVRRANDNQIKIDERLPLNMRLGVGLDLLDWLLAADVSLSLPQSTYQSVRAQDGSTNLIARDTAGTQVGDPIPIGVPQGRSTVVNLSVGARYRFSAKTTFQAGFFTDFSGQPDALIDELHPHVNLYGLTAGVSLKGTSSTTTIGLIATFGTGRSYGIDINNNFVAADAQSEAIYLTLGGTTRLGDAPEKLAPPSEAESIEKGPSASSAPEKLASPSEAESVEKGPTAAPSHQKTTSAKAAKKPAGDIKAKPKRKTENKAEDGRP